MKVSEVLAESFLHDRPSICPDIMAHLCAYATEIPLFDKGLKGCYLPPRCPVRDLISTQVRGLLPVTYESMYESLHIGNIPYVQLKECEEEAVCRVLLNLPTEIMHAHYSIGEICCLISFDPEQSL